MLLQICLDLRRSDLISPLHHCLVWSSFLVSLLVSSFSKMSPHFLEITALGVGSPVIESDKGPYMLHDDTDGGGI